ncbi:MAG: hypothetical protein WCN87_04125 [Chlamydiota bacterium]
MLQRTKNLITALVCSAALYAATDGEVISRSYVAKYLGKVSEAEWEKRGSHGEVITIYNNGVTVSENYLEGRLQGRTTRTYPHSDKIAQTRFFEEGRLVKEVDYYSSSLVKQEIAFNPSSPGTRTIKSYREDGTMSAVETLQGSSIIEGQYFDTKAKFLSSVIRQTGERTFVDECGKITFTEHVASGAIVQRTSYYPSGSVKSRLSFKNNQIEGTCQYFLPSGAPARIESWAAGKQNGTTTLFENGDKTVEISFVNGKKNGLEKRFRNGSSVAEEISWHEGVRDGASTIYANGEGFTSWYFEGKKVNQMTYDVLSVTRTKKSPLQKK